MKTKKYKIKKYKKKKFDRNKSKKVINLHHIKTLFIIFLAFILYYLSQKSIKIKKSEYDYYCCFCVMGKMENHYARELISYYLSIGVDKFVVADNNDPNTEKFSDVLQDYIKNGTVDILDIIGKDYNYGFYYGEMYKQYKKKCKWLSFFDFDEYLVMHFNDSKNLTLNEFLPNNIFDKCEAIQFNWFMHGDNDLVYYDNRTSMERFTRPDYGNYANKFVKVIIRGGLNKTTFESGGSIHTLHKDIFLCNSLGEIQTYHRDNIDPPIFKYGYLIHYNTRTAEEYVRKVKRCYAGRNDCDYEERVRLFFIHNKFTEEKLKVFEKNFNRTFHIK